MASIASMASLGLLTLICGCAAAVRTSKGGAEATEPLAKLEVVSGDMRRVAEAFNAHADRVRVLEIVSPTCDACLFGARLINERFVKRYGERVATIVVWIPMVGGDTLQAARRSGGMYDSGSVVQFYDEDLSVGWAFAQGPFKGAHEAAFDALPADHWLRSDPDNRMEQPPWDVYLVYAPGVRWKSRPPMPTSWIRHLGVDERGQSSFWRDSFLAPPVQGDLAEAIDTMVSSVAAKPVARIELLGFPGCPNMPAMRRNLGAAIDHLGGGLVVQELNQESLAGDDVRKGFPSPTVLVNGRDLFGAPAPAKPGTRCRVYASGVPEVDALVERLRTAIGK